MKAKARKWKKVWVLKNHSSTPFTESHRRILLCQNVC